MKIKSFLVSLLFVGFSIGILPTIMAASIENEFFYTIRDSNHLRLEELLESGADPNARIARGQTPLIKAAGQGDLKAVNILLSYGADLTLKDNDGLTALNYAVNEPDIINILLKAGADPNSKDNHNSTALMDASYNLNTRTVKLLLAAGANPTAIDKEGNTAFDPAAMQDDLETVKVLFNSISNNTKYKDFLNQTLVSAASTNSNKVINYLITKGANTNIKDNQGKTPLIVALGQYYDIKTINLLLRKGANPNIQDNQGNTALMYASKNGLYDASKALIKAGANTALKNKQGKTALQIAKKYKHKNIIFLLNHYITHKAA